ncbi:MAG: AAA family ATPase [Patescibacteria group bacterium]
MKKSKFLIVVLAGFSCSGKSIISKKLSDLYGFDLMEQHIIYKNIAFSKGYKRARHWLRDVGKEIFIKETTLETIRQIKSLTKSKGVIIDAHYGPKMHSFLSSELPETKVITILLTSNKNIRVKRMTRRINKPVKEAIEELNFRDDFLKTAGLKKIKGKADFIVVNNDSLETALAGISQIISNL